MYNTLIMLFAVLLATGTTKEKASENKYVKVHVSVVPETLKRSNEGELLVRFLPVDGIHVNTDPPMEFRFHSTQILTLKGEPDFALDKETGYLATASPVRQRFIVATHARPGEHIVKGAVVYYYCSDDEGWCTKFTQPVELPLKVTP